MSVIKYNRLMVTGERKISGRLHWMCRCECGTEKELRARHVERGIVKSCGCLNRESVRQRVRTHGRSKTNIYGIWASMIQRCVNSNSPQYRDYGGRGVTVCDRWRESFEAFAEDTGDAPTQNHSLDRKDNNGRYSPENCRWATRTEQNRNSRNNRLLTYQGKTQPLSAWAEELSVPRQVISDRINKLGWPVEKALSTPVRKCCR